MLRHTDVFWGFFGGIFLGFVLFTGIMHTITDGILLSPCRNNFNTDLIFFIKYVY